MARATGELIELVAGWATLKEQAKADMIESLLELSRVRSGHVRVCDTSFPLRACVEEVAERLRAVAAQPRVGIMSSRRRRLAPRSVVRLPGRLAHDWRAYAELQALFGRNRL